MAKKPLENELRVCAIMIAARSRFETKAQSGKTPFIESSNLNSLSSCPHAFFIAADPAYLVCVFQAAALAIVIFTPLFMPDLGTFLGPLVCPLVGLACWLVLLSPFLLPLLTLSEYKSIQPSTEPYPH